MKPTRKQLLEFAESVAKTLKDGDMVETPNGKTYEHMEDGNDDNVDSLYEFISEARDLTGVLPAGVAKLKRRRA